MVVSQARILLRAASLLKESVNSMNRQAVRNSSHGSWAYRRPQDPPARHHVIAANATGTVMWFWILWHLFTQYDHIIGEFDYPDAHAWTDEELGIPPLQS